MRVENLTMAISGKLPKYGYDDFMKKSQRIGDIACCHSDQL
jgi:hypothetical protein